MQRFSEKIKNIFEPTWKNFKSFYKNYLLATILIIAASIVLFAINALVGHGSIRAFKSAPPSLNLYMSLRLFYFIAAYAIGFTFFSACQAIFVNISLGHKIKEAIKITRERVWPFTLLLLLIALLGLLTFSPLYAIVVLLFLSVFPAAIQTLLMIILGLVWIALIVYLGIWASLLPYIMIDKKLSFVETLKKNREILNNNRVKIFLRLLYLTLAVILIELIFIPFLITMPNLSNLVLNILIIFGIVPYAYSYLAHLYKELA